MDRFVSWLQLGVNACAITFAVLVVGFLVGWLPQFVVDIGLTIVALPTAFVLAKWVTNTSPNHG